MAILASFRVGGFCRGVDAALTLKGNFFSNSYWPMYTRLQRELFFSQMADLSLRLLKSFSGRLGAISRPH